MAENAIRSFVIGRKNWLFSGSPAEAHASATQYSLVETAKLNKLEPYAYMRYLLENTPVTNDENFKELLPTRVTQEQIDNFLPRLRPSTVGAVYETLTISLIAFNINGVVALLWLFPHHHRADFIFVRGVC
ncbi:MAG: transposase domain-containing protein [Anaerolineaceae bacterium]|nr:transposase domain-containing protein [Anaerolineaceae bacterium]